MAQEFGAFIIGDEIISGKRQDKHFAQVIKTLGERGLCLAWCQYLGDHPARITAALKASMASEDIVFCFGGIGATPDDHTRQCAAAAAGVPIERHAGAVAEIEAQYGERAYPKRVLMADFPAGAELIPNPVNRVAGFSLKHHYFMPGFPEMAWPMLEWVLDHHYAHLHHQTPRIEQSILVFDAGESQLLDLMNEVVNSFPQAKLFCLPQLDQRRTIELGLKGEQSAVELAMAKIQSYISDAGYEWHKTDKRPNN